MRADQEKLLWHRQLGGKTTITSYDSCVANVRRWQLWAMPCAARLEYM
jgi:hypothetical protein